jgi:hypothetical protein
MNNRIDVILVVCGMIIGFIVIIMHLTGLWPCSIINKLDKTFSFNYSKTSALEEGGGGGTTFKDFVVGAHFELMNLFRCK